jgi:2-oxoglutarate dehydrogenase E1 component
MLQIPIFHVNGEDLEAIAQVARLAADFRQTFHRDVVIDFWCYRKFGHNEGDEPSFTQPLMYEAIAKRPSVRAQYAEALTAARVLSAEEVVALSGEIHGALEKALADVEKLGEPPRPSTLAGIWSRYHGGPSSSVPDVATDVPRERLVELGQALTRVPEGFSPHPKLARVLEHRREMVAGTRPLDWGMGEALALGTLLARGTRVRMSGQDARRGTFSHRHAVLFDAHTGQPYAPLAHLGAGQGVFEIYDSPLNEAGVLGFEYGYSLDMPDGLVLWEAQFGDFVNAAQVIIDQFIFSSEAKWSRISGLTLLLPHGMEGQGPEHSSARLERFLNLCVDDNVQVCNLTTPAQLFHVLRRQVRRNFRKPLVIMSPKSLLRHPQAVSDLDALARGGFEALLPDPGPVDEGAVKRVLLCTGKVFYDLTAGRAERKRRDIAILRLEQLYPLREDRLLVELSRYPNAREVVWVQEEPRNMGAWNYMNARLPPLLRGPFDWACISRAVGASPASGSAAQHKAEQARIVEQALQMR